MNTIRNSSAYHAIQSIREASWQPIIQLCRENKEGFGLIAWNDETQLLEELKQKLQRLHLQHKVIYCLYISGEAECLRLCQKIVFFITGERSNMEKLLPEYDSSLYQNNIGTFWDNGKQKQIKVENIEEIPKLFVEYRVQGYGELIGVALRHKPTSFSEAMIFSSF